MVVLWDGLGYVGRHRATVELLAPRMFTTFYEGKHRCVAGSK